MKKKIRELTLKVEAHKASAEYEKESGGVARATALDLLEENEELKQQLNDASHTSQN